MIALALALAAIVPTPSSCETTVKAGVAFVDDGDPVAAGLVEDALSRGCFDLVELKAGSDEQMLREAADARLPWLLVARAGLVEALEDRTQGTLFSVDVTAFDTAAGERRGRAMRSANLLGRASRATGSREAIRVVDDAVHVLRRQITEPAPPVVVHSCAQKTAIVLLWSKSVDEGAKAAVLRGLEARCVEAPDQFVADRAGALEFARDLKRPLIAINTHVEKPHAAVVSHVLTLNADVVDADADALIVTKHVSETRNALRADDDADAWSKVEVSLVGRVLDEVLPRR